MAESSRLLLSWYAPNAVSAPGRMVGEVGGLVLTDPAAQVRCSVSRRTARARSVRAQVRR